MRVALVSMCMNRLAYTQACFKTLDACSGVDHDHYVLDQGSADGTRVWLADWVAQDPTRRVAVSKEHNVGLGAGLNLLIDRVAESGRQYDVVVKVDNDCELLVPNTIRDVARATLESGWLLSPRILGLTGTVPTLAEVHVAGETILETPTIGGIFLAAPASLFLADGYRHGEDVRTLDDWTLCQHVRGDGGHCGYVARLSANHYRTTRGQHLEMPEYFEAKRREGLPV